MSTYNWMPSIKIQGYRPFKDIVFQFQPLQVIVGANGSGKSSLFEFLRFLREACYREIPPEIIEGSIGQQVFHRPGPDKLTWQARFEGIGPDTLCHQGELLGPVGSPKVVKERVFADCVVKNRNQGYLFMDFVDGSGEVQEKIQGQTRMREWDLKKPVQLGLGAMTDSTFATLYGLREFVRGWRFYNAFNISNEKIRKSVPTAQEPVLNEDAGNLSAVLFYLMTEHPASFNELQSVLGSAIPGFKALRVKARGGPGEVIAFWQEDSVDAQLSLADLSDGTLRFIAWATLAVMPNPPSLICIDEPDQGVHPRTLPVLAGLLAKAAERTQVILATHSSYFLTQFAVENIAVTRKIAGESRYVRIGDSQTLVDNLAEFGTDELEKMHRSDELEVLS